MSSDTSKIESTNVELQEIINNSWDGICIIDKKTQFIYLNDAFSPMLGFSKEELFQQPFLNFIEFKYKSAFLQLLKNNIQNSYNTDINVVCQRKDGKNIYIKTTVSLMQNKKYFVVNAKDITKEISDDEILNHYVLSFHINPEGVITKVSNAFCKLSGYGQNELIDISLNKLRHQEEEHNINLMLSKLKGGKELKSQIHFAKKNGDAFIVDLTMKPIFNKYGDVTGYTALMFDITTEIYLDKQLNIENSKLQIMSETIKTISHEWRQPLNIISLKAQNLQFEIEDKDCIHTLEEIKNQSKELSDTIEDFQNIMKNSGTKVSLDIKSFLEELAYAFNKKEHSNVDFHLKCTVGKAITINKKQLQNIFNSLFYNSYEAYCRNSIEQQSILISTFTKNNTLHLFVEDYAGGIKEEDLGKIFEPYFSTKERRHGVGLGLYKCKMLIQMHLGGAIHIQNTKNGTQVSVTIPL